MSDYQPKLLDPRWQKKRLEVLQRDEWKCACCSDAGSTLMVHHLVYNGDDPWDSPMEELETLCQKCHEWREWWNSLFGRGKISTRYCRFFHWSVCRPLFDDHYIFDDLTVTRKTLDVAQRRLLP